MDCLTIYRDNSNLEFACYCGSVQVNGRCSRRNGRLFYSGNGIPGLGLLEWVRYIPQLSGAWGPDHDAQDPQITHFLLRKRIRKISRKWSLQYREENRICGRNETRCLPLAASAVPDFCCRTSRKLVPFWWTSPTFFIPLLFRSLQWDIRCPWVHNLHLQSWSISVADSWPWRELLLLFPRRQLPSSRHALNHLPRWSDQNQIETKQIRRRCRSSFGEVRPEDGTFSWSLDLRNPQKYWWWMAVMSDRNRSCLLVGYAYWWPTQIVSTNTGYIQYHYIR